MPAAFTPLQWGPYGSMDVDSYELGMKSMWWDDRVRFNITGFYEELNDMQAQVNAVDPLAPRPVIPQLSRMPHRRMCPASKPEVITQLTEDLNINIGYGYTDADYSKFNSFDLNTGW